MRVVGYFLIFTAVAVAIRIGFHFWRPLADNDQVWFVCMIMAAAACFSLMIHRQRRNVPVQEKSEPRFQGTSPYDGGVIVGGSAMAANVGLPGADTPQGYSGGGSPGHSSCSHPGDGGGDGGGGCADGH